MHDETNLDSAERLRSVIENAPIGLAILSLDLRFIEVNPAFCQIIGYRADQLLEMNAAVLADPDSDLHRERFDKLLRGDITGYPADARFRAADGTLRWAALSVSVLRAGDGSPLQYIAQLKDIGERKRAEAALLDTTRRLREAEAVGHSGSWELDLATENVTCSDGLFTVFGVDPGSFGGTYDSAVQSVHPDDRAEVRAAVDDCRRYGVPVELRYRITRQSDGALRWCEARAERFSQDGTPVRIGGTVVDISELQELEDRFRQVIEYAPMGLAVFDMKLRCLQANSAFCEITGYSEAQLATVAISSIVHPVDPATDRAGLAGLVRGDVSTYTSDTRIRTANGTIRWIARSASVLRSADGSPLHYIVQIKDIGQRKRAEQAQLDTTRRLRDAETVGHLGSWEFDIASQTITYSDGLLAVYGLDRDTFDGTRNAAGRVVHPDDRARIRAAVDACVKAGIPVLERYRLSLPDQELRWCETRAERYCENGEPVRVNGTVVDITDIQQSEDRFRELIERAPMGQAIIDLDMRYVQVNPAFCAITGYSEAQLLQMTVHDIADSVDPAADQAGMTQLLSGELPSYTSDTRFHAADGTIRWVARSASMLRAADGSPLQFIVQIKDIGERKRAEQVQLDTTRRLRDAETVGRLGSWELNLVTGSLTFSDGLFVLYGINPATFSGSRDITAQLLHPDDRARVRAAMNACIEHGVPFHLRYRLTRPLDGELRWCETRAERFEVDGKPVRVGGTVVDVSELALAEAEIRTAYTFQQTVMDASPDLIFAYQVATRSVVWSNRSLAGVLGFPAQQAESVGQTTMDSFVPQTAARELEAALLTALESVDEHTPHINLRLQDAAGGYRWFSLRATPLHRDDDGAINQLVGVLRDVTDAIVAEKLLKHSALHDSLTGLPNRALLIDRIDGALARSGRDHREISVLFCDLDGFKHINDTAGHRAGDAVLIETARRLQGVLREGDTVARVGGDEFIILVEPWDRRPNADETVIPSRDQLAAQDRALAPRVAARITQALREPIVVNGVEHVVTASIGITYGTQSLVGDLRSVTADEMLQDADAAMYKAKSHGKNRFEIFEHSMRASLQERGRVEHLLRQVLNAPQDSTAVNGTPERRGRLAAAYQPVFSSTTDELIGFEALARLSDADGSNVPPDVFITIAEESGLIRRLGVHILDLACSQLASWRSVPGTAGITMAVNVSALQAADGTLGDDVHRALTAHGLEASDIILELTETALLQAEHSTISSLGTLHDEGIGIAIDDFGIGYASLRYLATLPVSALKIDKSFTAGLPDNVVSSKIVMAVAGLAADLGLTCIVEGVETEQQLDALPPGVQLQGYLTGRPQPPDAIDLARLIAHGALPTQRSADGAGPIPTVVVALNRDH